MRLLRIFKITVLLVFALGAFLPGIQAQEAPAESPLTEDLDPAFAVEWMAFLYQIVEKEAVSAPEASRIYAYAGITLYESLLPGIPLNSSLSWQLNELGDMPFPYPDRVYDWATSADTALATVLEGLFASASPEAISMIRERDQQRGQTRKSEVPYDVYRRSRYFGKAIGRTILDWATADRYSEVHSRPYEIPTGDDPSLWVVTAPDQEPVEPYWGEVRPFLLEYADECAVYLDLDFSTEPDSFFYLQAMEVMETGSHLAKEQREIAEFWIDTPGLSGTPSGHWVLIENQLVDLLDLPLDQAAEMYALVGVTLADSFISCWSLKYQKLLLRPETYIQRHIRRGWIPYVQTPGFPEYPSGHSVVSSAAAMVLTELFGQVAFTDRSGVERGLPPRSYTSFEAAAYEAAISRLYGGIHYRAAIENGMQQGRCVGNRVNWSILLNPIRQGE